MARMFPEWISQEDREADPKQRAELKVYDTLERDLSDDWYVFYRPTWTWVEDARRLRTRETDFIVAHPNCGILLIEVKGGRIEVREGRWISVDRDGYEWDISPYEQIAVTVRALERRLEDDRLRQFKNYHFSTAVCFPDVALPSSINSINEPHQRVTIDALRMENLREAIVSIMRDEQGRLDPPGDDRIRILKELVARSWYINAPKHIQIEDVEAEIKQLTSEQFEVLYQLAETCPRLLISGCAGSGKTLLAAETARRMALRDKKRVLLTCYNRSLATWIQRSAFFVDNGKMTVLNYQKLCRDFARKASLELPEPKGVKHVDADPVFKILYPNALLQAADTLGEVFDAIIVDEAQDFLDSWWTPLLLLLKKDGFLHIYYDGYQQLWGPSRRLPTEVTDGAAKADLTRNMRNTKSIHDLAMRFHPAGGSRYKALCSYGIEPEFVPVPANEKEHQVVRRVVEHLIFDEKVPPHDIAILTPLSLVDGNSYWNPPRTVLGLYRLEHNLDLGPNQIFCSSIGAAKGLEFPVVILTEVNSPAVKEEITDLKAQLYVGISRARSHLIVMTERERFDQWQK